MPISQREMSRMRAEMRVKLALDRLRAAVMGEGGDGAKTESAPFARRVG